MTLPPGAGKRNDRFRDLVDVLLMESLVTDYASLREACETVFRIRGTHPWPPAIGVPPHWIDPFARLAREMDLPVTDAEDAVAIARAFIERIVNA
jgi:hypothetical protein